ncbi:IS4 family transposase [Bradyrhizobium sp.]|uniref:IS4 family transposase n=1 Tax=Bradyrhizobium sp. TaxID=376 RepID=UPI0025C0012C|nr:IS4 family transposase [Bradyrhizobium sp.]MBV8920923.1 IS4 family transposase [Bradyrhizobium sp.]
MVARSTSCVKRAAGGDRAGTVRYGRFLSNEKVTLPALIQGWSEQTRSAAGGRHVLAIQDTSEINFKTRPERRRGLGEIGKGSGRGVLLHAMLALDAESDACLGLVAGEVWTRAGRVTVSHAKRPLEEKESKRWVMTAECAKEVLAAAASVTVIDDREGDIYPKWAGVAAQNFDLLSRVMHDRALTDGSGLYAAGAAFPVVDKRRVDLIARFDRPARQAELSLRFGRVTIRRPETAARSLPQSVDLNLIEVIEDKAPAGVEPLHWRLLTTHEVADVASAWRIVDWYKRRWTIEQLFRLIKTQGLQLEDSRLETADRLLKLTAIAAKAAVITLQLVQAREGKGGEPASLAFNQKQIDLLAALGAQYEGRTKLQSNPHPDRSLAWAAWIIARLGSWDGYPRTKPGPITFRRGLEYFLGIAQAFAALRDV